MDERAHTDIDPTHPHEIETPGPEAAEDMPVVLRLVSGDEPDPADAARPDHEQSSGTYVFPVDVDDRRRHRRFRVARAGKMLRRSTQQYYRAVSVDVSFSGAMVEVETPGTGEGGGAADRALVVGELVDIGLAHGRSAVVPSASLLQGMVVRVEPLGEGRQRVAVRYLHGPSAVAA